MNDLGTLIENYGVSKEHEKLLKTELDDLNKQIKSILCTVPNGVGESTSFEAKYQIVKSDSLDTDGLLAMFMKSKEYADVIDAYSLVVYKPVLDMEALEKALYDNQIDPKLISEFTTTKEVERLTVKRKKESTGWKKRNS